MRARIAYTRPSNNSQAPKIFAYAHAATRACNACNNVMKHSPGSPRGTPPTALAPAHIRVKQCPANRGVDCRVFPILCTFAGKIRLFRHFRAAAEQPDLLSPARECTHKAQSIAAGFSDFFFGSISTFRAVKPPPRIKRMRVMRVR